MRLPECKSRASPHQPDHGEINRTHSNCLFFVCLTARQHRIGQFMLTAGGGCNRLKPRQAAKDGQRDTMHTSQIPMYICFVFNFINQVTSIHSHPFLHNTNLIMCSKKNQNFLNYLTVR